MLMGGCTVHKTYKKRSTESFEGGGAPDLKVFNITCWHHGSSGLTQLPSLSLAWHVLHGCTAVVVSVEVRVNMRVWTISAV